MARTFPDVGVQVTSRYHKSLQHLGDNYPIEIRRESGWILTSIYAKILGDIDSRLRNEQNLDQGRIQGVHE